MEGVVGLACSAPPMLCVPWRGGAFSSASTVITTCAAELRGCQVALQVPLFRDVSGSDGSLSENEAVTFPAVIKFPQSSTMVTSTGVGQAATVEKLAPSWVNTGNNLVGVQDDVADRACAVLLMAPPGITISSTAMVREEPSSAKCNWISP